MYICICQQVTDHEIKDAICQGACTLSELSSKLGIGLCCGQCQQDTKDIIDEALNDSTPLTKHD